VTQELYRLLPATIHVIKILTWRQNQAEQHEAKRSRPDSQRWWQRPNMAAGMSEEIGCKRHCTETDNQKQTESRELKETESRRRRQDLECRREKESGRRKHGWDEKIGNTLGPAGGQLERGRTKSPKARNQLAMTTTLASGRTEQAQEHGGSKTTKRQGTFS
jgi:hypothetical protein